MFLLGADPELFVKDKAGKFISGYGMIPGTKDEPFKVESGAVQVDGMALEFNIDPAKSAREFSSNIKKVMTSLKGMVGDVELAAVPTAYFGKEYMETQPKEALELGCDPDYDAYSGKANPRPDGNVAFRTGAGHIHIGWTEGQDPMNIHHFEACRLVTRALDYYLFPLSQIWDKDKKRRELYGKQGAFRPKPYGVEYRVLSNAWVGNTVLESIIFKTVTVILKTLATNPNVLINFITHNFKKVEIVSLSKKQRQYIRDMLRGRWYNDWDIRTFIRNNTPYDWHQFAGDDNGI